jgi:hypothetical protein
VALRQNLFFSEGKSSGKGQLSVLVANSTRDTAESLLSRNFLAHADIADQNFLQS